MLIFSTGLDFYVTFIKLVICDTFVFTAINLSLYVTYITQETASDEFFITSEPI